MKKYISLFYFRNIPQSSIYNTWTFKPISIFFDYNLKMNPVILLSLLATLCAGNLVSLSTQCPEQSVPDLNKVCISPDYIEGCQQYKTVSECFKCLDGTF